MLRSEDNFPSTVGFRAVPCLAPSIFTHGALSLLFVLEGSYVTLASSSAVAKDALMTVSSYLHLPVDYCVPPHPVCCCLLVCFWFGFLVFGVLISDRVSGVALAVLELTL